MNKTYLISGVVLVILIIIAVVIMQKNKAAKVAADTTINQVVDVNCVPYTQKQADDALRILKSKCGAKLLIPVVGIGAYNKCVSNGRAGIPEVKFC